MEQAFEELKSRIAALEAKVAALPSPQEFASIKSDVEFLKSDAAPRATSTAEAALKVAYGMKEELAQNSESINRLHEDITALKRSEAVAQPGRQLVPLGQKNVIAYLKSTEVDMFSPKVLIRRSSNDVYTGLGRSGQSLFAAAAQPNLAVVEILLKEPVQVNGFTFSSMTEMFPKKAQIVVGGQHYEFAHQVCIEAPKKRKGQTEDSVRSDFSPKMVSWVRIEQKEASRSGNWCLLCNLELHPLDPEYTSGVVTILRHKNSHLRDAWKVFVHRAPPVDGLRERRSMWAFSKTKFSTFVDQQP